MMPSHSFPGARARAVSWRSWLFTRATICAWLACRRARVARGHSSFQSRADDCDLLLSVTERTPYTTTLNLTYRFDDARRMRASDYPDMGIRIYHDARLVEAQEWAGAHPHGMLQALRRHAERELDQRWARNVMLNKWLEYCLERGHRFSPATLIPAC